MRDLSFELDEGATARAALLVLLVQIRGACDYDVMQTAIALPSVERQEGVAKLLSSRRSTKIFDATQALDVENIASLVWAATGLTTPPHRVSPSAHAANPVGITVIAGNVIGLKPGSYLYDPLDHRLEPGPTGDRRGDIATGTLDAADWISDCPALLLLTADMRAARQRFPDQPTDHGEHFVWMEAGHSAENVYLMAAEKKLGICLVAGFDDDAMTSICRPLTPPKHQVLGILALGHATTWARVPRPSVA